MRLANILRSYLGLPIACALGVAIGVVAIYGRRNPHDVRTVSPVYEDISSVVSTNGKVFPITDFQARAATPGIVGEIYVHVGQRVSPGQLLIKIKDPFANSRFTSAVAGLKAAQLGDQNIRQGGSQEDEINFKGDLKRAELEQEDAQNKLRLLQELQKKEMHRPQKWPTPSIVFRSRKQRFKRLASEAQTDIVLPRSQVPHRELQTPRQTSRPPKLF